MRILVTGGTGFLGTRVTERLIELGHTVICLVRGGEKACTHPGPGSIEAVTMDLTTLDTSGLPARIDAVIALAQARHYRQFPDRAVEVFAINVAANMALFDWARMSGVGRFVLLSSGGIYGELAALELGETERLRAPSELSFYLRSKLCAEMLFQTYARFFSTAVVLRPFFIYGPGQRPEMLVPRLIQSVRSGQAIAIQGKDGARLTPIYVDDAANAVLAALELEGQSVLNVAGSELLSIREMTEVIARALGCAPAFASAPGAPTDLVAETRIAHAQLGVPKTSFSIGIARTAGALE